MKTIVAGLAVLALAGPVSAQVKYVDEAGITHYAQTESMVPERYRPKAKPVRRLPPVRTPGAQGGAEWSGPLRGGPSGPSRVEKEDQQRAREMSNAAAQNAARKQEEQARKDEFNRCVGTPNRSTPCF